MKIAPSDKISAVCAIGVFGLMAWGLADLHSHVNPVTWWSILTVVAGIAGVLFTYVIPEYIDRGLRQLSIIKQARRLRRPAAVTLRYPSNDTLSPPVRRTSIPWRSLLGPLVAIMATTALAGTVVYRRTR